MASAMPKQKDRKSADILESMTVEQQSAFEYWFNFGNLRRLQDVADHFGLLRSRIAKWKNSYNWKAIAELRMQEVHEENNKVMLKTIAEQRNQLTRILDMGLDAVEKAIRENRLKFNASDVERLVKLRLLTLGDNTDSIKHEFSGMSDKDLVKQAESILQKAIARGSQDALQVGEAASVPVEVPSGDS